MSSEQIKCQGDVGNITAVQFIFLNLNKMVGLKAGGGDSLHSFMSPECIKKDALTLCSARKDDR